MEDCLHKLQSHWIKASLLVLEDKNMILNRCLRTWYANGGFFMWIHLI
jgi:hypothetical protein